MCKVNLVKKQLKFNNWDCEYSMLSSQRIDFCIKIKGYKEENILILDNGKRRNDLFGAS